MYNVRIRLIFIVGAILTVTFSSCSGSSSYDSRAEQLYSEASEAFQSGDYDLSLALIDSIDSAYAKSIEVRKECRLLKPQVIERLAASKLSKIDSLQAINEYRGDSLRQLLTFENNALEGYFVGSDARNVNVRSTAGIHSRVSPDYHFYIVASCPEKINMTSVGFEADGESIFSDRIGFDGERNTRDSACETITFTEKESASLAHFVATHPSTAIKIVYKSDDGREYKMELNDIQRRALTACYGLVIAANNDKAYRLEKEKWSRQLDLARRQLATVADTAR